MMKNLDTLEREKQEREAAEALLSEVQTDDQSQQSAESDSERLYTKEEVRQIVSAAVAKERGNLECREYLLNHYYDMYPASEEISRVLRILEPKSVDELKEKMKEIAALDAADGTVTRTSASSKGWPASLRQIFVRN